MFEKLIKSLNVLKGGAKKRKRKILKRKKKGGDGESHDVSIDGKEYICSPKTEDVETNTEEVAIKEKHDVIDNDVLDDDITSSPDDTQDGGGKRKRRIRRKRGGSSCSGGREPHMHMEMSGGKKKKGGTSCSRGQQVDMEMSGGKKKRGGSSCSGGREPHVHMEMSGGKKKKVVKKKISSRPSIKTKKKLYREYLDKKYTKEQLLKKCRKVGIKITKKADGTVKPIKKKTIIEKIIAIKFK
tara:strand:+ start:89 stop:811 length:723 start_codon:yes stop_codon:yes gene_type:complete